MVNTRSKIDEPGIKSYPCPKHTNGRTPSFLKMARIPIKFLPSLSIAFPNACFFNPSFSLASFVPCRFTSETKMSRRCPCLFVANKKPPSGEIKLDSSGFPNILAYSGYCRESIAIISATRNVFFQENSKFGYLSVSISIVLFVATMMFLSIVCDFEFLIIC